MSRPGTREGLEGRAALGAVAVVALTAAGAAAPGSFHAQAPAAAASGRVHAQAPAAAASGPFHAQAPPAAVTGGFGEPTCVACHIGNDVNAYDGRVRIEGLPGGYVPGEEYVLTIELSADGTSVAGFQLAARFAEGASAGTPAGELTPVDDRTAVTDSAGVSYLHQTRAGSVTHDPAGARWSFAWLAPGNATGPVAIHVAANSGNGDNSPLGDLVYADSIRLRVASEGRTPQAAAPRF